MYMIRVLIILLLLPVAFYAQDKEDDRFYIKGIVYSTLDSSILNDVHVINYTTEKVTTSYNEGIFKIPVKNEDKLFFSSIGYELTDIIIADSLLQTKNYIHVYLKPKTYELKSVDIRPFLSYKEFKEAFLAMEVAEDLINLRLPVPVFIPELKHGELGKVTISGPITALYMKFSKEGKSLRKYEETLQQAKYQKYISSKFNKDIVRTVTSISEDEELKAFMDFCDFSEEFIASALDYEIYIAIKDCYLSYLNIN